MSESGAPVTRRTVLDHVPGKTHYELKYLLDGRLYSYAHQVHAVLAREPAKVLEIGTGAGIMASLLRSVGLSVTTLDIQPELSPNLVGSVLALPLDDSCFDVSVCCQVLEHLPFSKLRGALGELRRVTTDALVMSVPDITPFVGIAIGKPPRSLRRIWQFSGKSYRSQKIPAERLQIAGHHWEIGYKGSSLKQVCAEIAASRWSLARSWRVFEKPWHRFFLLERR